MTKYINADEFATAASEVYLSAQSKISDNITRDINCVVHTKLQKLLADAPAANVVPVVHAKWEKTYIFDTTLIECSNCGKTEISTSEWEFCPNCGARMDGDNCE